MTNSMQNLPPRIDVKHVHEKRRSRQDSKASRPPSLHRSSSLVFRTLPPIRRMPSLQVSLADITNPHSLSTPRRSLHQISETEATTYKLKLPLTLVHPNSPYVPWDAPVRQKILCPASEVPQDESEEETEETVPDPANRGDKKPIKHIWTALKSAPKTLKTRCQRLLGPRSKDLNSPPSQPQPSEPVPDNPDDSKEQVITYTLDASHGALYSPATSFRSSDTNTLAIWLAERQRKFLEKDCESGKIMTIEDYERLGSWIKPGDPRFCSRSSYHCSFVDGDTVSSICIMESEHDLASSPIVETPCSATQSPFLRSPCHSGRSPYGAKRVSEEDRLSRIVHRSSLRSYLVERSLSVPNAQQQP
ncbi:hypothetical protein CC1G_03686 [Coprinopsis cinerea okayama7|uniref:Uncharacterized protein n=1 Tax=Coprinopsis cinerea (strain Okayama-7 / 130 / ATCC MYA-4618 / FGSC 9003) TaxID=240176 RepID=A8N1Z3_COPC7|nr:hypothetical protein CC1G_03686 [Coprinopsis cinerea okayama7\|eukprot:XP_001828892.2 hypothetical protein CC1G_03686 [Coprinopsis cinerea okayama7\